MELSVHPEHVADIRTLTGVILRSFRKICPFTISLECAGSGQGMAHGIAAVRNAPPSHQRGTGSSSPGAGRAGPVHH
ncbi:hypothetical protein EVAR_84596_1 [Eumeta japonica]|uniref:Uncharacterized protein n=1 Tax=Eumeta variegata TaxID=151549 RepID=A0A4C1ZDF3_EUMVA|nr:hypothetical protein EVAR_84596_1 [Eumeta japonica]